MHLRDAPEGGFDSAHCLCAVMGHAFCASSVCNATRRGLCWCSSAFQDSCKGVVKSCTRTCRPSHSLLLLVSCCVVLCCAVQVWLLSTSMGRCSALWRSQRCALQTQAGDTAQHGRAECRGGAAWHRRAQHGRAQRSRVQHGAAVRRRVAQHNTGHSSPAEH